MDLKWCETRYPGYYVSVNGDVLGRRGGLMKHQINPVSGYHWVKVGTDPGQKVIYVHTLVCETFHGPRPEGLEVRHLNGDLDDNSAENLAWGTHRKNAEDMIRHGRSGKGDKHYTHKLSDEEKAIFYASRKPRSRDSYPNGTSHYQAQMTSEEREVWRLKRGGVTNAKAREVKALLRSGAGPSEAARVAGVTLNLAKSISQGRSYTDV